MLALAPLALAIWYSGKRFTQIQESLGGGQLSVVKTDCIDGQIESSGESVDQSVAGSRQGRSTSDRGEDCYDS